MTKLVVGILNPGAAPADNGRTVHALKLAKSVHAAGGEVLVVFEGEGVKWLPRFLERTEESHPFDKHYGPSFDEIRPLVRACNMCCIRFDVMEKVAATDVPILGEGKDHVDVGRFVMDGYQVINH